MQAAHTNKKPFIIFVTGVSGAGKTTFVKALSEKLTHKNINYLNFDSIGVPSEKEMKKQYGSGAAWQKAMLHQWVERILNNLSNSDFVVLDGQVSMDFIKEACKNYEVLDYSIILIHCENHVRHERLEKYREQPELINAAMDSWANHLKRQAIENRAAILDTTDLSIQQMVEWFEAHISNYSQTQQRTPK